MISAAPLDTFKHAKRPEEIAQDFNWISHTERPSTAKPKELAQQAPNLIDIINEV